MTNDNSLSTELLNLLHETLYRKQQILNPDSKCLTHEEVNHFVKTLQLETILTEAEQIWNTTHSEITFWEQISIISEKRECYKVGLLKKANLDLCLMLMRQ